MVSGTWTRKFWITGTTCTFQTLHWAGGFRRLQFRSPLDERGQLRSEVQAPPFQSFHSGAGKEVVLTHFGSATFLSPTGNSVDMLKILSRPFRKSVTSLLLRPHKDDAFNLDIHLFILDILIYCMFILSVRWKGRRRNFKRFPTSGVNILLFSWRMWFQRSMLGCLTDIPSHSHSA